MPAAAMMSPTVFGGAIELRTGTGAASDLDTSEPASVSSLNTFDKAGTGITGIAAPAATASASSAES